MRIIDSHTHIWPDALAPAAIAALSAQGDIRPYYDGTAAGLTAAMDGAGVDASIILPVATKPGQVRTINDWVVSLLGDPRIVPFAAMHPDFPDPAAEIARVRGLGLTGFKMHPEYQSFELLEPRMAPIYDAAVAHGMTLYFHAGGDIAFRTVRGMPEVFAALLDRWPEMRAVLAHMGGFGVWEGVATRLAGSDVYFDTAFALGHLPDEEFVALVRAHGADRIMFGTDGPWADTGEEIAHLRRLPFTDVELAAILGGNAERMLGR